MTKDGMHRLVVNFPVKDMRHIMTSATYRGDFESKLDGRIAHIRENWRTHYGHDFSSTRLDEALESVKPQDFGIKVVFDKGIWSARVSHSMTAESLRSNLLSELTSFDENARNWPKQESDAYRELTHYVILAVTKSPSIHEAQAVPAAPARTVAAAPAAKPSAQLSSTTPAHHWWQFWSW